MGAPVNGTAETLRLTSLYAVERTRREPIRQRTHAEIIAEADAAADGLSAALRSWRTVPPHPSAVEAARCALVGLGRLLAELAIKEADHDPAA
jgi:hypothetical protein